MKRLLIFSLWLLVFCGALFALDQTLLRIPLQTPVLRETQIFYRDFRARLLLLCGRRAPAPDIDTVIEQDLTAKPSLGPATSKPARAATGPPPSKAKAGYVYVDRNGELKIAERLEEIPPPLRRSAQPLIP